MKVKYYAEEMELYWRFICERQMVFKKKELMGLPPPWTENPILKNFKFTNIKRTDDRGTRFVTEHIYPECPCDNLNVLFNIIVYRLFNKIETFLHHGFQSVYDFDKDAFTEAVMERDKVDKVFTNAFIVSGYSQFGSGMPKIKRMGLLFEQLAKQLVSDARSGYNREVFESEDMAKAYYYLLGINGIGPFLGYQIAVDLSYWNAVKFGEDDFVIDGPGAKRGLAELFPEDEIRTHKYEYLNFWLRDKQFEFWKDYGIDHVQLFDNCKYPYLTVMDLENVCCEFSKYVKAVRGEGRPRNTYSQEAGFERLNSERDDSWQKPDKRFSAFDKEVNCVNVRRLLDAR